MNDACPKCRSADRSVRNCRFCGLHHGWDQQKFDDCTDPWHEHGRTVTLTEDVLRERLREAGLVPAKGQFGLSAGQVPEEAIVRAIFGGND